MARCEVLTRLPVVPGFLDCRCLANAAPVRWKELMLNRNGMTLVELMMVCIIIGLLSWVIGGLLAFPVGAALSSAVGRILFQTALPYTFSATGVFTWLGIVVILAGIASFLPAWNASRLTVREVLAYE